MSSNKRDSAASPKTSTKDSSQKDAPKHPAMDWEAAKKAFGDGINAAARKKPHPEFMKAVVLNRKAISESLMEAARKFKAGENLTKTPSHEDAPKPQPHPTFERDSERLAKEFIDGLNRAVLQGK